MQHDFLSINGLKIHYSKKNKGKNTLIFIHHNSGNTTAWKNVFDNAVFDGYCLIGIDLPGHGNSSHSPQPETDYHIKNIAATLLETINMLNAENFILVAASLGTNVIGEIASKLNACKGFCMVGSSMVGGQFEPQDVLLPFEHSAALFSANSTDTEIDNLIRGLTLKDDKNLFSDLKAGYLQTDPRFREELLGVILRKEWADEIGNLANTGKPVMLVYGEHDQLCNKTALNHTSINKWEDKIHIMANAGHLAHLDQPELFNQLLLRFAEDIFADA